MKIIMKPLSDYEDELDKELKIFLYGTSGVGKTTFVNTFKGKKLLLSTDGRFKHLKNKKETDVIKIAYTTSENGISVSGWDIFKNTVALLKQDNGKKYKNIIVDLLTDIHQMCRIKVLWELGITHESELGYGKAHDMIKKEFFPVIKDLFDINANIIVIAHEKNLDNGAVTPDLPGAVINKLQGYVTLNGRMSATQTPGEEMKRMLYFMPSFNATAANIVGIEKPIEATYGALIHEINKRKGVKNDAK